MRRPPALPAAVALLAALPVAVRAQGLGSATLVGVVTSAGSGEPLAYATAEAPAHQRAELAGEGGIFRLRGIPTGTTRLVVRRIGFAPLDTTVVLRAGAPDTVRVRLARVAARLAGVRVRESRDCIAPGPPRADEDPAFHAVFEQLRMNAEQYRILTERHPFTALNVVRRADRMRDGKDVVPRRPHEVEDTVEVPSQPMEDYEAGRVVRHLPELRAARSTPSRPAPGARAGMVTEVRTYDRAMFMLPSLIDLAGPEFQSNHCFAFAGTRREDGAELARIDFRAARAIRTPDVDGSIYLDAATYQLRRLELRMTRPGDALWSLGQVTVVTSFREVVPSIPVAERIDAVMLYAPPPPPATLGPRVGAVERQRLLDVRFEREPPPAADSTRTPR